MSRAASLPGAELVLRNQIVFEQATCPRQPRCRGRTFSHSVFEQATCPGQLRCWGQNLFSESELSRILGLLCAEQNVGNLKNEFSRILGLLCAEQDVGNLKKCTFNNSLSIILGLLCATQNVGNLKKCTFRNSGTPVRRTKRQKIQKNALPGILGLLCAEQNVRNLKKTLSRNLGLLCAEQCTFRYSGAPVRRTKRRKFQKMHFQEVWDSCAQNKTSEISKK